MKNCLNRSQRLELERQWYDSTKTKTNWVWRFVNNRLLYSPKRHKFAYELIYKRLLEILQGLNIPNGLMLIAACGGGHDVEMLRRSNIFLAIKLIGIDISEKAIVSVRQRFHDVPIVCGDLLCVPFKKQQFDIILCDLFLHHVVDEGFDKYLKEFSGILKPNGYLVIQEPSIYFPFCWITILMRKILYRATGLEIIGHVHHEKPFSPWMLLKALKRQGFREINTEASSFVHNRFYLLFGNIIACIQKYLYRTPILKYLAWNVIYVARNSGG